MVAFFVGKVVVIVVIADRPTGNAFAGCYSFGPPAIDRAKRGNTIESGFHAGCAGGFHEGNRIVEPEVGALGEDFGYFDIVIFQVGDFDGVFIIVFGVNNFFDYFLSF